MSEILVNTIKKADGTGSITVPATTGTLVDTSGADFTDQVTVTKTSAGASTNGLIVKNADNTAGTAASIGFAAHGSGVETHRVEAAVDGANSYSMRFYTYQSGLNERMRIDASGRVTMPYQPLARAACSTLISATNKIPLNTHNLSNGGLSIDNTNNRMIVPVDGHYVVGYSHLVELANSNVSIRVNGNTVANGNSQTATGANNELSTHTIVNLSANDYVEFWVIAGRIHNNATYNSMYCYLLG